MSVKWWIVLIVMCLIVIIAIAILFPELDIGFVEYAETEPMSGPTLISILPVLLGAGIVVLLLAVFLPHTDD